MSDPRFVPALASWTDKDGSKVAPTFGVLDTLENTFAPFGRPGMDDEEGHALAEFAASRVAAMPGLPWTFTAAFELVQVEPRPSVRFEWIKAAYPDGTRSFTSWGAVDNELGRFYPFSNNEHDPEAQGFVASVAAAPEGKYAYPHTFARL
ncbi:hypothetical protein SEA_CREWMATE_60 [Arthrobacter phage Crewmate]|uniref:Uncharacterized protein n=1 Tax=Arthrobacter phage Crewmate TaxID=2832317 RepID=A0AA48Y4E5_9CAUD|nr:hypothetical protein PQE17_gp60 [Arthrobacter phage Crewmate]UIW13311.1 hypothetical protein SEA_CREWMATE_60 [Arthrobacter phage Crewmate]